jgi:hypothetical protein
MLLNPREADTASASTTLAFRVKNGAKDACRTGPLDPGLVWEGVAGFRVRVHWHAGLLGLLYCFPRRRWRTCKHSSGQPL